MDITLITSRTDHKKPCVEVKCTHFPYFFSSSIIYIQNINLDVKEPGGMYPQKCPVPNRFLPERSSQISPTIHSASQAPSVG